MKNTILILITLLCIGNIKAQILYDNGPIDAPNNSFTLDGRSWDHTNLTYFFENGTVDIPNDNEKNAVLEAMSVWEASSEITFTEVSNAGNADIIIKWATENHGDSSPFDGTGGVLAHAFFPPPNSGSLAGDVHFDDSENWSADVQANSSQPIDLVTVAIHELGHSLGLRHSDVFGAIMYAYYNGSQRYLANDDIQGISKLYPKKRVISGTNTICNSANYIYTINDITVNNVVSWSTSSNIERIIFSNSGITISTINSNATGHGWIKANIDGIEVIKYIWIGKPKINITGLSNPEESTGLNFCQTNSFNTMNYVEISAEGKDSSSQHEWVAITNNFGHNTSKNRINIQPYRLGTIVFKARVSNSCGWSDWAIFQYSVIDCSSSRPDEYNVYPNPASRMLTIQRSEPQAISLSDFDTSSYNQEHIYRLYDFNQNIVSEGTIRGLSVINVSNFISGRYILKIIISEGNSETHHIIIN